jgi:hypothetical protein
MWRSSIIGLVVVMAMLLVAASAAAALLPPPGGFRLQASHGYSLRGLSFDGDSRDENDALLLIFNRKGSVAMYVAQKDVVVTGDAISADLGDLGSIDLHFVPTGQPRDDAPTCIHRPVEVDSGAYEGRVEFEGEERFTEVHATRALGDAKFTIGLICAGSGNEGAGGNSPGARLLAHRKLRSGKVTFEAWKNSPTRPAWFEASIEERRGALAIGRGVSSSAGPGSFEFDVPAQSARVRPSSPFAGSAHFTRAGKQRGVLRGRLSVDFPGRSGVSLTGARGGLIRFVKNPGHPFLLSGGPNLLAWPSTKPSPIASAMSSPLVLK